MNRLNKVKKYFKENFPDVVIIAIFLFILLVVTSIIFIRKFQYEKDYISPSDTKQIFYQNKESFQAMQKYICSEQIIKNFSDEKLVIPFDELKDLEDSIKPTVKELADSGIRLPVVYLNENENDVSRISFFMGSTSDGSMQTYLIWYSDSDIKEVPPSDTLIEDNWYIHQFLGA